jgi:hypothetical protein
MCMNFSQMAILRIRYSSEHSPHIVMRIGRNAQKVRAENRAKSVCKRKGQ